MENNQQNSNQPTMTQEQMFQEILKISRQTRNYMKWQLYITVVLIVLPLLAMAVMLPLVMKSLGTLGGVYGPGGTFLQ
ncbi:MAG: hypothetical protein M1383_06060 [Patescibacteria group bacterium]|nr:hypothetical protein [Patescibacteria group bacterium]